MKTILAIIFATILTGCYQRINITEIMKAEKYCSDKLGVLEITEHAVGVTRVHCVSGDSDSASLVSLLEEAS